MSNNEQRSPLADDPYVRLALVRLSAGDEYYATRVEVVGNSIAPTVRVTLTRCDGTSVDAYIQPYELPKLSADEHQFVAARARLEAFTEMREAIHGGPHTSEYFSNLIKQRYEAAEGYFNKMAESIANK